MIGYTEKIQEIAARLLKEGKVDAVIGFKKGSQPLVNEPCIITDADKASDLVWDSNCRLNLANYLTNRKDTVAVVAKGCDSRNIVNHILENKIKREQVVIIGVPCKGMINKTLAASLVGGDVISVTEADGKVTVASAAEEKTVDRAELLQDNCRICTQRNPVISDEMVADAVPEQTDVDRYAKIREIEAMDPDARWAFFDDIYAGCTRCYACKNACPLCYCPTCFVDESQPQWVGKGTDIVDVRTYHFLRAFHCAGRCTDCGACEAACPMDIPVRLLTLKLEKGCKERYDWTAGMSLDARPALDAYRLTDPEEFIR